MLAIEIAFPRERSFRSKESPLAPAEVKALYCELRQAQPLLEPHGKQEADKGRELTSLGKATKTYTRESGSFELNQALTSIDNKQ